MSETFCAFKQQEIVGVVTEDDNSVFEMLPS